MALIPYRADLATVNIPFLTSTFGRTCVIGDSRNFNHASSDNKEEANNFEAPQPYYMENVIPTEGGMSSVGYSKVLNALSVADRSVSSIYEIRNDRNRRYRFTIDNTGQGWIVDIDGNGQWVQINLPASYKTAWTEDTIITTGYAQGDTYLFLSKIGCMKLDDSTGSFPYSLVIVTLLGINATLINGLTASSNYLILYDDSTFYWSSVDDVTDFVPDVNSGADASKITDVNGNIKFAAPTNNGFTIYTTANMVSASYTSNLRNPWNFSGAEGSAGVQDPEQVSFDENASDHIAWTSAGIQRVRKKEAVVLFPNLSDFITRRRVDTFNSTTNLFETAYTASNLKLKLKLVGSRYLIISYGIASFTNALFYDLALKRWGNLKIDHVDVFSYVAASWNAGLAWSDYYDTTWAQWGEASWASLQKAERKSGVPGHTIAFLKANGEVYIMNSDLSNSARDGLVVLGRFQHYKSKLINLQQISVETVRNSDTFSVKVLTAIDGRNGDAVTTPYHFVNTGSRDDIQNYLTDVTGTNVSIVLKGAFNLNTVLLQYELGGIR